MVCSLTDSHPPGTGVAEELRLGGPSLVDACPGGTLQETGRESEEGTCVPAPSCGKVCAAARLQNTVCQVGLEG